MSEEPGNKKWILCPFCHKPNPTNKQMCQYCWSPFLQRGQVINYDQYQKLVLNQESSAKRGDRIRIAVISSVTLGILAVITLIILFVFTNILTQPQLDLNSNSVNDQWNMFRTNIAGSGIISSDTAIPEGIVKWKYKADDVIRSSASIVDGILYFGDWSGKFYALDTEQGKVVWEYKAGSRINSSPSVYNGIVCFGANTGYFYACDANTGKLLWDFQTEYAIFSSPAIVDNTVYFGADDDNIYALDLKTGKRIWQKDTTKPVGTSIVVANGIVYACNSKSLVALDANRGRLRLSFIPGYMVASSPVVSGSTVYFMDTTGYLYAVDGYASNWPGEHFWKPIWVNFWIYSLPVPKPPPQSGALWVKQIGESCYSSPVICDNVIYVAAGRKLAAVDLDSREILWTFDSEDIFYSSPVIANNVLYIGCNDGKLYAVDAKSGLEKWAIETGDEIRATPAVVDGVVYIGSSDGYMYAIE